MPRIQNEKYDDEESHALVRQRLRQAIDSLAAKLIFCGKPMVEIGPIGTMGAFPNFVRPLANLLVRDVGGGIHGGYFDQMQRRQTREAAVGARGSATRPKNHCKGSGLLRARNVR